MGQTVLSCNTSLSKTFEGARKSFLRNLVEDTWENNIVFDVIISWSEFTENVCKYNANQTIFDKDWLNWSKWTIYTGQPVLSVTFNC